MEVCNNDVCLRYEEPIKFTFFSGKKASGLCWGPAPAGSRGTLRMNGVVERETRRTGLDRAKSARERERKKETRPGICSRVWQALFFTIAFIP